MFTLAKLAYYSCDESQRHWYNSVPKNIIKINIKSCCDDLI